MKYKSIQLKPEETEELNGILGLISDKGELSLKNKKLSFVPRTIFNTNFAKITVLDL
jgi:hypothetical protein